MASYRADVDRWADGAGFGSTRKFHGRKTTIGGSAGARQAGFYLLMFRDDSYYLGESVDLRARMAGHAAYWGPEIDEVRFIRQNMSKQDLRSVERGLIYELNKIVPQRCRNKTHTNLTFGNNALDEYLTDDEQQEWLAHPAAFNGAEPMVLKPMTEGQSVKYSTAAQRFRSHPLQPEATRILRDYLENCVPSPRRTEFQGWSVSTGTYGGARLLCVTVGKMETFVAFADLSGFVVVRKSIILQNSKTLKEFTKNRPGVRFKERQYNDSGADTAIFFADTPSAFQALLSDPSIRTAAARLVLDVMRKHPCVYTRYHCPQIIEHVYAEAARDQPEKPLAEPDGSSNTDDGPPGTDARTQVDGAPPPHHEVVDDATALCWFVNAGPQKTRRNTLSDFIANGEWRMDPNPSYELHVQEMLPGEKIAVRKRRNTRDGVPFDPRGHLVSVMDILLTGTITSNPGDGCSVKVDWDPRSEPRQWYLYTNQNPVWAIPVRVASWTDELIEFTFNGGTQNLDYWRNQPYWRAKFGDR